jgi:hypothetical protein
LHLIDSFCASSINREAKKSVNFLSRTKATDQGDLRSAKKLTQAREHSKIAEQSPSTERLYNYYLRVISKKNGRFFG